MAKRKYEFKLYKDGSFKVKEIDTGKIGAFRRDGSPVAGPLCLEPDKILAILTAFSDISLPGTFKREVELEAGDS